MVEPKIYFLGEREIHMLGDYVGVCWNTLKVKKPIKGEDGQTYTAIMNERAHGPYIDFVWIVEESGEAWEDEDSPVEGGITATAAEQIAEELRRAVEYMKGRL